MMMYKLFIAPGVHILTSILLRGVVGREANINDASYTEMENYEMK